MNTSKFSKFYYDCMKNSKKLLITAILLLSGLNVQAEDYSVSTFSQLMGITPQNGDTIDINADLTSTEAIGNNFAGADLLFDGNEHYIDGRNIFSGFVFNQETQFNQVGVRNCKGQTYNNSTYAGAVFNNGGVLNIESAAFNDNFVDSNGLNLGIGGAVYNLNNGTMDINNSLFANNYANGASSYGGALANGNQTQNTGIATISNSTFLNNHVEGSVTPLGGAIYNNGTMDLSNTRLYNNYVNGNDSIYSAGGAVYNTGEMTIDGGTISNNYAESGGDTIVRGGAIYNNNNLTINNATISNNYATSNYTADGGAIYNGAAGTLTINNSLIENNRLKDSPYGDGGAIYNENKLIIGDVTFRNNYDLNGQLNDIMNNSTGTIDFDTTGTTNILSGISGGGIINKKNSGTLNLGGINQGFNGLFNFEQGTVNLLANSSYFGSKYATFGDNVNLNLQNGQINNIELNSLTLNGTANIFPDVNFSTNTMDTISATDVTGSGSVFVPNLSLEGTPQGSFISIPFANDVLKDYVQYNSSTVRTPLYNYTASYDSANGHFNFSRGGFNSGILSGQVAAQLAGYLTMIDTYKNVFSNLDMVMITPPDTRGGFTAQNKVAMNGRTFAFSPFLMPEQRKGVWFKPYSTFENVRLDNGPKVSNVSYGSMFGVESGLTELKNGWYTLYGGYASYNGSHQAFDGNSIYNNGGLLGVDAVFYKGGFFSAWTANAGANSADASTNFRSDNFSMLNAGVAQKTGYNFETLKRRLIIQPSILTSYTFINTFNYTPPGAVIIHTAPLHALQIEPQIKLIGNFKEYLQPYLAVSMVWNIIDHARFQANDVYLPDLSVQPFVQYGVGVQKRYGDRFTGFLEAMIRNGGRNGIALQFGLRISL